TLSTKWSHACAIGADHTLWCWGDNDEGQLGIGDAEPISSPGPAHPYPTQVGSEHDWLSVACGQGHTCGIRSPGELWCWGRNSEFELALPHSATQAVLHVRAPARVGSDSDWLQLSAGQGTTCGLRRNESGTTLWCWGEDIARMTEAVFATPTQI